MAYLENEHPALDQILHTDNRLLYPPPEPRRHRRELMLPPLEIRQLDPLVIGRIVAWLNPEVVGAIRNWPNTTSVQNTATYARNLGEREKAIWVTHHWALQDNTQDKPKKPDMLPQSWNENERWHVGTLIRMLEWGSNPEVRRHIDPPPPLYQQHRPELLAAGLSDLALYHLNYEVENGSPQVSPNKVATLIANDESGNPRGCLTIRWRGDPYIPPEEAKTAGVERIMVDPEFQDRGTGTRLVEVAKGEIKQRGFEHVRAWVMIGPAFGRFDIPLKLFLGSRFKPVKGSEALWSEYRRMRNIPPSQLEDEEALWLDCDLTQEE